MLVNNAGIIPRGNIVETNDDMWFSALDVNLNAVFFPVPGRDSAHAGGRWRRHRQHVSSTWGVPRVRSHRLLHQQGRAGRVYQARWAAITRRTASASTRFARTRSTRRCCAAVSSRRGIDPENAIEELGKTVPLGHVAEPEEIADVIAFLASHDARYVCGEIIEVSGAKPVYG